MKNNLFFIKLFSIENLFFQSKPTLKQKLREDEISTSSYT
jgi:hypothetical protein